MARSIALILSLLFVALVAAVDEDVRCVVYSNDCAQCMKNGCGWCSEGFCAALQSDICSANKISTSPATCPGASADQRVSRQTTPCDQIFDCATCQATTGCQLCVDSTVGAFKCRDSATTCSASDPYDVNPVCLAAFPPLTAPAYNWASSSSCPVPGKPNNASVPTLQSEFTIPVGTNGCNQQYQVYVVSSLSTISIKIEIGDVVILSVTLSGKRSQIATVKYTFADPASNGMSAAALGNALVSGVSTGAISLPANVLGAPIIVSPAPTTTGNPVVGTTGSTSGGGGGSDIGLSRGALAGIIIGSIVGGMLIIALIAWLIFRSRESYPLPFRSPAAAYRP